jgi:chromosome segregation ATPase
MREREEMKRQIKSYKDKYTNCEKNYRSLKSDLKMEKENSEKLFMEIVLNEKGTEQMNKTIKELTNSIQENNEKIAFLLNEKQKNTNTIRNLNDYIEKLESEIKDISDFDKEMQNMEENFLKELNTKQEIINKLEMMVKFKNSNIDALYDQISLLTKESLSFSNSNSELMKTIDSLKTKNSKKITELQLKLEKSVPNQRREFNKSNMVFSNKNTEDEFELLKLENDTYKVIIQDQVFFIVCLSIFSIFIEIILFLFNKILEKTAM